MTGYPKIVAIIPAYNEGPRIQHVIEVLASHPVFDEVYVVDDGSADDTYVRAMETMTDCKKIRVIRQQNAGKGQAMDYAVRESNPKFIFFADADITELSHETIDQILLPVLAGETSMMIAMRNRSIYTFPFVLKMIALLGGERALTRELWDKIPSEFKDGFKIETALNYYAARDGGYKYDVFDIKQTIKEKKYGLIRGLLSRFSMFFEVLKTHVLLRLK